MASDHAQEECALHPNREVPVVQLQDHQLGRIRREEQAFGDQRRRRGCRGACYAYNDGRCAIPFCLFEHIRSVCEGDHKKTACQMRGQEQRHKGREKDAPSMSNKEYCEECYYSCVMYFLSCKIAGLALFS